MPREEVKVTHGCGCGGLIGFILVIGLIYLVVEDIGENPGTWIPILAIAAVIGVAALVWYLQEQQRKQPQQEQTRAAEGSQQAQGAPFEEVFPSAQEGAAEKQCPDCAETVKAAARVCRFCGHRFDQPG